MGSEKEKEMEKWGLDLNLSIEDCSSGLLGFQDFLEDQTENHDSERGSGSGGDLKRMERDPDVELGDSVNGKRLRYTIEEKGKAKVDCTTSSQFSLDFDLNLDLRGFEKHPLQDQLDAYLFEAGFLSLGPVVDDFFPVSVERNTQMEKSEFTTNGLFELRKEMALSGIRERKSRRKEQKSMQREIARNVAPRFAHLGPQEQPKQHKEKFYLREVEFELESDLDDSQSPFSLAMEAVKMRQNVRKGSLTGLSESLFKWVPVNDNGCSVLKRDVPKLLDLSLSALARNADAILSLEHIPDSLRHRLSQLVSDSGGVDAHFVELLARGSPTEIRVRNISQLTEEEFSKIFGVCDTKDLTVLQLDLCGRCVPDYVLRDTLARSSHGLPCLATISLKGAHRLTDIGLTDLAVSAPALQSINLSQCSLLTSQGISYLAGCFESTLRELYINDCQNVDAMMILPALKKLKNLELLSVAGIQTVRDDFVIALVRACGINLKELGFASCLELTDTSVRLVGKNCPNLCALDLSYLHNLTDSALRHLANGCRSIRRLKLCRNGFSDEAIGAFLEASGQSLNVLSLNNIHRVALNTALSIAKCSRNLLSLDLSWCRKLTDEALGLIVDSCLSLKLLKLFGCTQITEAFLSGHSNPQVRIIGCKTEPVLENLDVLEPQETPLKYSPLTSFC